MAAFQKFDVQAYLRGEYEPPQNKTLGGLGTLGHAQTDLQLTESELEQYEEREAIMEFDGNLTKADAEAAALQNVTDIRRYRK